MLKKTLVSPLGCKEIKPVNPKGNQPWLFIGRTDAEALILWLPDAGKDRRQEEKGLTEDEMVGWHHRLNAHESEQIPGDSEGQGCLACCSLWALAKSWTWLSDRTITGTQPLSLFYTSSRVVFTPQSQRGGVWQSIRGTLSKIFTSWSFAEKNCRLPPSVKTLVFIAVPLPVRGTIYISLLIPSLSPSRFNGQLWFRTHQKSF